MRRNRFSGWIIGILAIVAVTLILAVGADAATEFKVLHVFTWAKNPSGNLTFDAAGNLYGTTQNGGAYGYGAVYKLAPNPNGSWTESVLHGFARAPFHQGPDGANPEAGLVFDPAGNLYGTTRWGGYTGCGVVFKVAPNPDGTWTESVLNIFGWGADGCEPLAGLIFDAGGNLYGTTDNGGLTECNPGVRCGVVFKLLPNARGDFVASVLHTFTGAGGEYPRAGLIFDAAGNLYGTTSQGGCGNMGVVFKLAPNPDGTWKETVLHSFAGNGRNPDSGLIIDKAGNLYGTVPAGSNNNGFVFEITP